MGPTDEGTPQGGPLSPLLSNLVLDDLDKELERRGHRFARYADDCNIYVRSQRAGERVMESVERLPHRRAEAQGQRVEERGRAAGASGSSWASASPAATTPKRRIAPQAIARFKERVRETDPADARREPRTDGRRAVALSRGMARLLRLLRDPFGAARPGPVDPAQASLRRLEAVETRANPLCGTAPPGRGPRSGGSNRRKPPRPVADQPQPRLAIALPNAASANPRPRFPAHGPNRLTSRTAVYGPVRTVVWEGRSREASSSRPGSSQAIAVEQ